MNGVSWKAEFIALAAEYEAMMRDNRAFVEEVIRLEAENRHLRRKLKKARNG